MIHKKQALVALFAFGSCIASVQNDDFLNMARTFEQTLKDGSIRYACNCQTWTPECTILAQHLQAANKVGAAKQHTLYLKEQVADAKHLATKKIFEDKLQKAILDCPDYDKTYLDKLSSEEQEELANILATFAHRAETVDEFYDKLSQ